ncbi:hypothetical protein [Brevundimonas diminuta]|uniref:hypothetical protein n=1 Tax=Brevundimonas diminuta TaxID=293 RepID=UPI0028B04346|nr:hypothetical protein [Brevundimonas diminuta]
MTAEWPSFKVVRQSKSSVTWEGSLTPFATTYRVSILYEVPSPPQIVDPYDLLPKVKILSPKLEAHPEYEEGPIPHLLHYSGGPFLCIFDPYQREWSGHDLIAQTTVYWALRWLLRYEGWLATGRWHGKGIHYGPPGRFHPDDGSPLRWYDRWTSTASAVAFRATVPHIVDRWWRHKGNVPGFHFDRYRTQPVRGRLRRPLL